MASSLLHRFRAKPRITTSDTTMHNTTYVEKLNNIWKTVLDDTQRTLQQHNQQQLKRKREKECQPYLVVADIMHRAGLDATSQVSKCIEEVYRNAYDPSSSDFGDLKGLADRLSSEFQEYRVDVRTVASEGCFDHMENITSNYTLNFFDALKWSSLFTNTVWHKYCGGIDHTKKYPLMYNTLMYMVHKFHPPEALRQVQASTLDDTSQQHQLKEEITKLRDATEAYWGSLNKACAANEKLLRNSHMLRGVLQPKVQNLLHHFNECLKSINKDPGYVPSSSLTFARGARKIVKMYETEVDKMDIKAINNLVAGFEATYNDSKKRCSAYQRDIDEYVKEWKKHKQCVLLKELVESLCSRFEQCLKSIEEIRHDLNIVNEEELLVKDFDSIHRVLKDDLEEMHKTASAANGVADKLNRSTLLQKQALAEEPCLTLDGEEFAYNVGMSLLAVLEKQDGGDKSVTQKALTQVLLNQASKFDEMIENPSLLSDNAYNHMQSKLTEQLESAMGEVRSNLKLEMEPVVTLIDSWYLKHLNNILQHCIDRSKQSKKKVVVPDDMPWNEFANVKNIQLFASLKDQTLKHTKDLTGRIEEFRETLEAKPRVVLMPQIRQWVQSTSALCAPRGEPWRLHDAWVYLDGVYKLMQVIHIDDNNLLS